ncbi:MAG: matrixin family metalloprotease, partial [Candidatus Delongbacteria bacterium]|nr:matrixin family metalloprotease [Candidatus Delongbacteria bacterium]
MKNKFFLLLLIIQFYSFGYQLMDSWLATPGSYTVYLTQEVYNLQASWGLNFTNCVTAVNNHGVSNVPTLVAGSNYSEIEPCIIKFETVRNADNSIDYSSVAVCSRDSLGEYFQFTIIVNDSVFNPAIHNINSVMTHELTHTMGLADNSDPTTLMYRYAGTITSLTNDEINGIKNVYEKPTIQVISPYTMDGSTYKIFYKTTSDSLEFEVTTPNMFAFGAATPPDLSAKGFFTDLDNNGYGIASDSLGNDKYRIKESINDLLAWYGISEQKFRSFVKRGDWVDGNYRLYNSPCGEIIFKIAPKPTNESPPPGNQYYTLPSGGKESITDTLAIKVRVPQILGAYPAINIKIDDVYLNQGDITFDSEENVWIYYWDLSTVSPTEFGKLYTITSEIDGDPISNDVTGIYLVEALFYEDFETITSLTAAGWYVESYESPPQTYTGWIIANHPVSGIDNQCAVGQSTASTSFYYWLFTPAINVPENSNGETKLEYKMNFSMIDPPVTHSYIKFYVCDENRVRLTAPLILYPVNGQWTDFEYDLTPFAGQTIKLQWWHYYAS